MLCRIMHTKRGNFWNELHKLDGKRIKLLLNKFVVKKDHEAMQYIIRNQEKERAEKQGKRQQKQAKIMEIKRSKVRYKTAKLKKLREREQKNFESVVEYLKGTFSDETINHILKGNRQKKRMKQKKVQQNLKPVIPEKSQVKIGSQKLFKRLTNLNNDIYEKVYRETHQITSGNKPLGRNNG